MAEPIPVAPAGQTGEMSAPVKSNLSGIETLELNPHFAALVTDDVSLAACQKLADANGWPRRAICYGNIDSIQPLLDASKLPKLLVVDLDGAAETASLLPALAQRVAQGGALVAIGSMNDVTLYRHLLTAGAADYLLKPLDPETLIAAAADVSRMAGQIRGSAGPAGASSAQGRLSLISGVRGGVGASTIAVNLAWIMAHELGMKTCLLDLDLHFGISALALDLEPGYGLREALESPERMDSLMLVSSMVKESETLSVLGAEEPIENSIRLDPVAVAQLIDELTGTFEAVVVDLPRGLLASQTELLGRADDLLMVTDLSLAGIRDCGRIRSAVEAAGSQARLMTVASRVGKDRPCQIDESNFERSLGGKLASTVPEDVKTLAACANAGKAIGAIAGKQPVAQVLRDLANDLTGRAPQTKPGLFGKVRRMAASF
ncbi:AAA family ATPase [Algihabitans albus]|uniref:AAA family ATPase n=1 Tax=Algihabitans albus TaxID=2164067 RepID=UPI000E5D7E66|nr:P-loop NTPase [Algihabitans albus]